MNSGFLQGLQNWGIRAKHPADSALLSSLSFEEGKRNLEEVTSEQTLEKRIGALLCILLTLLFSVAADDSGMTMNRSSGMYVFIFILI